MSPRRFAGRLASCFAALALFACANTSPRDPDWLAQRAADERALSAQSPAFHDFRFVDRQSQSGITFVNHVVEDAAKNYKAVHYDHGSGLCSADVDGDGRPDLFFVSQLGPSELWRNLGGGKFEDITAGSGITLSNAIAVGCAFADVDNDGLPDLFVTTVRHGNRLFKNLGGGKFRDITAQSGLGYSGHSSGAVFFDYDGDGLLDLFVANVGVYTTNQLGPGGYYVGLADAFHGHTHPERSEASILYHNLGNGRFEDVTKKMGLVDLSWSGDATALDVNDDGWPDLYVLNMQGQNHLWLNDHGRRFIDATKTYFPKTPWGAMGVKAFDYNGDGTLELLVTDMHSDMFTDLDPGNWAGEASKSDSAKMPADVFPTGKTQFIFGNALFARSATRSPTPAAFEDVSDIAGVETYWPWGVSVDDLNADGWDDVFVTGGMSFPFRYGINSVLLNEGGKHFLPAEFTLGVEPRAGALDQPWFDVDCAGADRGHRACQQCAQPNAREIGCRGDANGHLTLMSARSSRSSVIADLDGDGALDVVTNEFGNAPQVLMSDLAQRRRVHFVQVKLQGARSNREGIGAQVTLVLDSGRRLLKVMDGKSGYLSMSDLPLYFGLGDDDHAKSIEVRWPSGRRQVVSGPIASGKILEITEP